MQKAIWYYNYNNTPHQENAKNTLLLTAKNIV